MSYSKTKKVSKGLKKTLKENKINLVDQSNIKEKKDKKEKSELDKWDEIIESKTKKMETRKRKNKNFIPWIEKYRPKTIEDLEANQNTINKIQRIIDDKDMSNIIITGVPGIGKTTTITCIAKALLGKYFNQGVLELNASDDRGIKAVQECIINFCKKKMFFHESDNRDDYAKHKIILLDEADNMTKKAQQLINNLMEKYHNTTRFAFTCNNSSDIIEAIQSRCSIFRYKRLSNCQVTHRLEFICKQENIQYTKDGIDALIVTCEGDMRSAINNLQLIYNGYNKITEENVYKLCDKPNPITITNIFLACLQKDLKSALIYLKELKRKGYSSSDISFSMINKLKYDTIKGLNEKTKIEYMTEIGKTCLIISKGIDTDLQLTGCISGMCYMDKN